MSAIHTVQRFFPYVKKVVDARKPLLIEVTPTDAASKAVKDHNACALAVACKRSFHLKGVIISRSTAYLVRRDLARRYKLSPSAMREIVSFDRGGGFAPGRYTLSAVPKTQRLGVLQSGKTGGTYGGKTRFMHFTENIRAILGSRESN